MDTELPRKQADAALIEFFCAELALGFASAQTGKVEAGFDSQGEKRATELAKDAVGSVRWLLNKITDPAIKLELEQGANLLEKRLISLASETLAQY